MWVTNLIKDYVSGDVVVYRQEDLDSKEKIQETIGIVEDEIKAFETEISLRENEDISKNLIQIIQKHVMQFNR